MAAPPPTDTPQPLPQDLAAAALWYAGKHTKVFPIYGVQGGRCDCGDPGCTNVGKHPRTPHGFKDASSDPTQVAAWWSMWPTANIGMPTGPGGTASGVFVVDVDPRHGGLDTLQQLMDAHGGMPETREVTTGGGGMHLYFRCPDPPLPNTTNGLGPGIDTRGVGGYVLLPPSRHASGNTYQWVPERETLPPARVPSWVPETLQRNNGHGDNGLPPKLDTETILAGLPQGQRDDALFRMVSRFRWAGYSYERSLRDVLEAAANCTPPFDPLLARAKVDWVYSHYEATMPDPLQGQTETVTLVAEDAVRVVVTTDKGPVELLFESLEKGTRDLDAELTLRFLLPGTPQRPYHQRINLLSVSARESCRRELEGIYGKDLKWAKILADGCDAANECFIGQDRTQDLSSVVQMASVEMLVEGIMPAQGTTILFGAGSGTKTFMALRLAISIGKGIPFLGRATQQRNVLFVDYETEIDNLAFRAGRLLRGMGYDQNDLGAIKYWNAGGIPLLDQVEAIKQAARRHHCGVLVVDHAALACGTEPEKSDAALRVKRALSRIGLPCLLVAHITGDGETNPAQVNRPFGSVFWANLARRTWYINRVQDQESEDIEVGWYCKKNNDGRRPADWAMALHFEDPGGPITAAPADLRLNPRLTQNQRPEEQVWNVLEDPLTVEEIIEATGLKLGTVKHALHDHPKRFVNLGVNDQAGRGQKGLWARLGLL